MKTKRTSIGPLGFFFGYIFQLSVTLNDVNDGIHVANIDLAIAIHITNTVIITA